MRKITLLAFGAILALALSAGVAGARTGVRFSPTNSTIFVENMEMSGGFGAFRCNVTMSVAMSESVAKRVSAVLGHDTVAFSTRRCASGDMGLFNARGERVTGLQGAYEIQYESFSGELPNITALTVRTIGMHFWIREPTFGIVCESREAIDMTTTGGNPVTGMSISREGIRIEGSGCSFTSMTMRGSGSIYRELEHLVRQSIAITLV